MQESKQTNRPVLSLVVPCYNVARWIDRLLESVQKQTLTNFEVIAINDGSTDVTLERLVQWAQKDPRVRVLNQQNSGPHQARLAGVPKQGLTGSPLQMVMMCCCHFTWKTCGLARQKAWVLS